MRNKIAMVGLLILAVTSVSANSGKVIYRVIKLSNTQVGISCTNGGDPTFRKVGDVLIIACDYSADSGTQQIILKQK